MNRILLYEPNRQTPKHISLLLKVADLDCIVAEFIDEVLNWLTIDQLKENHFDLLLLNAWPDMTERKELFEELTTKLSIPVIYILREGQYQPSANDQKVSICLPENILRCIYAHLSKTSPGAATKDSRSFQKTKDLCAVKGEFKARCSCLEANNQNDNMSQKYSNKCHSVSSKSNNISLKRSSI